MKGRNPSVAPQTIAAIAATSSRPKDAARIVNAAAAMPTIPAASASMPSIRLTRFASAAIQMTVIGQPIQPRSNELTTGSEIEWKRIP